MRLAVHLQRNLDVHVLVLHVLMSSFVETRAVPEGRHGWAYVCAYLLDGRAATSDSSDCDSPAPETTTSTTELPRPRAVCPRAHSGCEYEFFFTYSAPLPTTCFGTPRTGCPSVFIGLRFR